MKNNLRAMAGLSLAIGIIFLGKALSLFPEAMATAKSPEMYALLSIGCLIFFCITYFFLFKHMINRDGEGLSKIESIAFMIQVISVILLLADILGSGGEFLRTCYYTGFLLLLLGCFIFFKTRRNFSISFVSWGIFIALWINSFYYGTGASII